MNCYEKALGMTPNELDSIFRLKIWNVAWGAVNLTAPNS